MTSVMKFDVLSFGENSKAEFIEAQVFAASSNCRASAAGVAAASPPHTCCWERFHGFKTSQYWTMSGQRVNVSVKLNGSPSLRPLLTSPSTEKGRDESERNDSTTGADFSGASVDCGVCQHINRETNKITSYQQLYKLEDVRGEKKTKKEIRWIFHDYFSRIHKLMGFSL